MEAVRTAGLSLEDGPRQPRSSRSSRTCRASSAASTPGESAIRIPSGRPSTTSTARRRAPTSRRATLPGRSSRSPTVSTRSPVSSALGLVPTGSQDPYGLRRAAPGHRLDRDRPQLAGRLAAGRPEGALSLPGGAEGPGAGRGHRGARALLRGPAAQPPRAARLAATTKSRRFSTSESGISPTRPTARRALSDARRHMDFRSLILAFKRIRNIVGDERPGPPSPDLYREAAERALAGDFLQAKQAIEVFAAARRVPGGHGDDRLDRALARPLLRGRPRQLPGAGPPHESAGALWPRFSKNSRASRTFRKSWWKNESRKMKRVFSFGNGAAEGAGLGKETLGGKGAGLAEMTALGIPVPPGFTIETSVCADFSRGASLDGIRSEVESALMQARARHRPALRRSRESAPRLGSLRRAVLDARDDGHDPEPRPDLADRAGPRGPFGRAVRARLPPAVPRDVLATSSCACRATSSRRS